MTYCEPSACLILTLFTKKFRKPYLSAKDYNQNLDLDLHLDLDIDLDLDHHLDI